MQARDPASPERIAEELERILAGSEFRTEETMLSEFLNWLGQRISPGEVGDATELGLRILLVLAGLLLLFLLVQLVRTGRFRTLLRRAVDPTAAGPERVDRIRSLLAEAAAARARGDLRLALRLLLCTLLIGLGERGDLHYHDAWTNRELLRRGRPDARTRELVEPLVAELEAKEFGRVPVSVADVDRLQGLCERMLGSAGDLGGGAVGEAAS